MIFFLKMNTEEQKKFYQDRLHKLARLVQKRGKKGCNRREHILMICRKQEYADYSTAFCRYTAEIPED